MKAIFQTRRDAATGDCLNCAIASILEINLSDIPDDFALYQDTDQWWQAAQEFMFTRGFQLWRVELDKQVKWFHMPAEPMIILLGKTKNGADHACVGYCKNKLGQQIEFIIVHDPLGGDGVESVEAVMFLVPVNPARQSRLIDGMRYIEKLAGDTCASASRRLEMIREVARKQLPATIHFDEAALKREENGSS